MLPPIDGYSYERSAITQWLAVKTTSPLTNEDMGSALIPNRTLRALIQKHLLAPEAKQ